MLVVPPFERDGTSVVANEELRHMLSSQALADVDQESLWTLRTSCDDRAF